jgi:adhesin HecA-like repeat protein|tara:strand:- start:1398 stop:3473 length:2076 start_codon:yes stop_codon:yes gene_type:complete
MAQSSKFAKIDEDILLEFIYHDQNASNLDDVKIENDNNGSQLKYLNTDAGDNSASRFLIHELGADVVEFTVEIAASYVYINNFAARQLILKNGKTYKFDLTDATIDNPAGFIIPGGAGSLNTAGTIYTYTPTTNGVNSYEYTDLAGTQMNGGEIQIGDKANSLYSVPFQQTGNDVKTAPGESGRYYAVTTEMESRMALLENGFNYLDSAEWQGTSSTGLTVVPTATVGAVWYDTIRLHLRTGYSFSARGYDGFVFQTKVKRNSGEYNYFNSTVYLNSSSFEFQNPQPFVLGEDSYSKYIEIKVPSLVHSFDNGLNDDFTNSFFGIQGDIDSISPSSNYEIDFGLISSVVEENGNKYINVVDNNNLAISREDEFVDIVANIEEAEDGDYFKIYGTKDGSQSAFENYVETRIQTSSDDILVFHDIEVSEQLGLSYVRTYLTTFVQTSQFDQALLFRPVILNSGISSNFLIRHNMRIYNETDNTQIIKTASLVYNQPKKYGKSMTKLNINSNLNPTVVYNTLQNTSVNRELNQFVNSIRPSVGETKYVPVPVNVYGVVTGATTVTLNETEANSKEELKYVQNGELEVTLSKVSDNNVKFSIAQPDGDSLKAINLVGAENMILIIKSGKIEQQISHNPGFPDVDMANGEVFFKIPKSVATRFDQSDTNKFEDKFYINIKNGDSETLVCYGKINII